MQLAGNANTPSDILEELLDHHDVMVHHSLARNPSLPAEVYRKLQNHPDEAVRSRLSASNHKKD